MTAQPRFCPLCERRFGEKTCPDDGVPTVEVQAVTGGGGATLEPGSVFGDRHRIVRVLGAGGMGEVYLATQLSVQRSVALKVLTAGSGPAGEKRIKRFYKEAQAACALHHPNIVRVYDFGVDDATRMPFLVLEYIEGETMAHLIARERRVEERRAARLLAQVARGLVEAHQKGVVHRDLKPRNIMITVLADGAEHVRLLDFGIARMRPPDSKDEMPRLTAEGVAVGTPEYMSPEQARGRDPDFRSDLYSLGCVLGELLSGKPPFSATDAIAVMLSHVREAPPRLDAVPGISRECAELYAILLEKRPEDRPSSTRVVAQILQALASGDSVEARRLLAQERATQSDAPRAESPSASGATEVPALGRGATLDADWTGTGQAGSPGADGAPVTPIDPERRAGAPGVSAASGPGPAAGAAVAQTFAEPSASSSGERGGPGTSTLRRAGLGDGARGSRWVVGLSVVVLAGAVLYAAILLGSGPAAPGSSGAPLGTGGGPAGERGPARAADAPRDEPGIGGREDTGPGDSDPAAGADVPVVGGAGGPAAAPSRSEQRSPAPGRARPRRAAQASAPDAAIVEGTPPAGAERPPRRELAPAESYP